MACNWLMVTSFGDNNWPSGPGVWVCSPTKLKKTRPRCGLNRAVKLTVTHTVQLRFCYCFYLFANVQLVKRDIVTAVI